MAHHPTCRLAIRYESGFTLVDILMVIAVGSILAGLSVMGFAQASSSLRAKNGVTQVLWQLRLAREYAMNQRRTMQVQLVAPNEIRIVRQEIPTGTTTLNQYFLEGNVQYVQFAGVPDTPDGFGSATPVDFGGQAPAFNAEGHLVDGTGATLSGTIFLGNPGNALTQRAVTVFGGTGRIRVVCRPVCKSA